MFYMKQSNRSKGVFAEDLTESFLKRKSFEIIARNYYLNHLEIDIIAKKADKIYFFEVKSVSRETFEDEKFFNPLENMTEKKLQNLQRAIRLYMKDRSESFDSLNLITVEYSKNKKYAKFSVKQLI